MSAIAQAANDPDTLETQEWLDALETVLEREGAQRAHFLLEALIAILIFSLGILGLVGLQAGMVKGTSEAKYRAEASYVAQREIGRIWADPNNAANYLQNGTDISGSSGLPGGTLSIVQPAAGSAYVVTVAWQQPGEAPHSLVTSFNLAGF